MPLDQTPRDRRFFVTYVRWGARTTLPDRRTETYARIWIGSSSQSDERQAQSHSGGGRRSAEHREADRARLTQRLRRGGSEARDRAGRHRGAVRLPHDKRETAVDFYSTW